jgi:peptidoglycan/xylan/chitin deacetylase (PgdA/CDA1 family)
VIALTFDGGAGAQGAAAILHTLQGAGVPATFFLTGQFVRSYPAVTAAVIDGHYLLGNHTMTHPHLTQLSPARVLAEVTAAQERIEAATAQSPRPWFRFPFGEYDARTLRIVHRLGYGAIGWTVDTRGWQGTQAGGVADLVARVHDALRPGAIVLMHLGANPDDGTTYDAVALPAVIAMVRAAGYRFVDLRHAFIVQIRSQ